MNIDLENTLELAVAWAKEVGEVQRSYFRSGHLDIETKSTVHDVVTKVDKLSESMLIERIGTCFPDHSVLGEESGEHDAHSDYLWVVDPLDGTNNLHPDILLFLQWYNSFLSYSVSSLPQYPSCNRSDKK